MRGFSFISFMFEIIVIVRVESERILQGYTRKLRIQPYKHKARLQ